MTYPRIKVQSSDIPGVVLECAYIPTDNPLATVKFTDLLVTFREMHDYAVAYSAQNGWPTPAVELEEEGFGFTLFVNWYNEQNDIYDMQDRADDGEPLYLIDGSCWEEVAE